MHRDGKRLRDEDSSPGAYHNVPSSSASLNSILSKTVLSSRLSHIQKIFTFLTHELACVLRSDSGALWLQNADLLQRALVVNRPIDQLPRISTLNDDSFVGLVTGGPNIINDISNNELFLQHEAIYEKGFYSFISHPLVYKDQKIGIIYFLRRKEPFSFQDEKAILLGCELLSLAIDHCSFSAEATILWQNAYRNIYDKLYTSDITHDEEYRRQLQPVWLLSNDLPKGIHPLTLARVFDYLQRLKHPVSSVEVSNNSGLSLASARRYLNHLYDSGLLIRDLVYTAVGRPSYLYSIADIE